MIALAATTLARALRFVARLLDPAGVDDLQVHVDAGSPAQVDELVTLVRAVAVHPRNPR